MRISAFVAGALLVAGSLVSAQEPGSSDTSSFVRQSADDERRVKELHRSAQRNIETKRWVRAIQDVKGLVALQPYDADYQLTLGLLFRKNNELDEARRKFREFLDLGGSQAVGHLLIGESYAAAQQREKVISHLRQAAENGMNLMKVVEKIETLKIYSADTEFIKQALQLEKYELEVADLQDPMTSRFKSINTEDPGLGPRGPTVMDREQQERVLIQAQLTVAKIERALAAEDEDRAMEAYSKLLELTEEAERFTIPKLAMEFRQIINRKDEIESRISEIRLKYHYREAQEQIERMRRAFKDRNYPRVEQLHQGLEEVARKMRKVDPDFQEVSERILRVGQAWVERARIRREFNAKPLSIQGIVLHRGAPYAIINNKLLRVGDRYEGMTVIKVEPNQIYFDYQGENIPLIFRRF